MAFGSFSGSIIGLHESSEDSNYNAIAARALDVKHFTGSGPPDLCTLCKYSNKHNAIAGHFSHYVVGMDMHDISSVSRYLSALIAAQEKTTRKFVNVVRLDSFTIKSALYCSYDMFYRHDVHIELHVPGIPKAYVIDQNGDRTDLLAAHWVALELSAIIRATNPPPTPDLYIGPLLKHTDERYLTAISQKLWYEGDVIGMGAYSKFGTNMLMEAFAEFFLRQNIKGSIKPFQSVLSKAIDMNVHVARAYSKCGKAAQALSILQRAIRKEPDSSQLLAYQARVLLKRGDCTSFAVKCASYATELCPYVRSNWFVLAEALTQADECDRALAALSAALRDLDPKVLNGHLSGNEALPEYRHPVDGFVHASIGLVPQYFRLERPFRGKHDIDGESDIVFGTNDVLPSEVDLLESPFIGSNAVLNMPPILETALRVLVGIYNHIGSWNELSEWHCFYKSSTYSGSRESESLLDQLFNVLHEDLMLFQKWYHDKQGWTPRKWLHYGALVRRLGHFEEMEVAFRVVQSHFICLRASYLLWRHYLKTNCARQCSVHMVAVVDQLVSILGEDAALPDWVCQYVHQALTQFGLKALITHLSKVDILVTSRPLLKLMENINVRLS